MQFLFPPMRTDVDDSEERILEAAAILSHSGINTDCLDQPFKWSNYPPQAPTPKQHAALAVDNVEALLWGGAAGGGKSSWGLQGALQYADTPGYAALILRRSFAELNKAGALIDRAREWLKPTDAVWRGRDNKFVFPSGATLEFGYLASDSDVHQYQSAEYQYIFFDELTAFTEFQFRYMASRLRRLAGSTIPLKLRAASNPGGKGHDWVRRCFPVDGSGPTEENWAFIPALLDDNPHVDQEAYRKTLENLDPYTRAQMEHGDWNVRPPGNWAYTREHIDEAINLGRKLDALRKEDMLLPHGELAYLGVDFGELSAVLLGWPLAGGGYYIVDEHIWGDDGNMSEPDVEAFKVLEMNEEYGGFHIQRMRYDAARPESQRLMHRTFKNERGSGYAKPSPISFAKYKRAAVRHLRALLFRSWNLMHGSPDHAPENEQQPYAGCMAISPSCVKLAECLYSMERYEDDPDQLVKRKDDPNDALLALVAPDAKKKSKLTGAPTPDEVQSKLARVAEAAESARKALFGVSAG